MAEYLNKELFLQSMGLLGDETKYGNRDGEHQSRSYGTWMGYEIIGSVEDSIVEEDIAVVVRCKDCKHCTVTADGMVCECALPTKRMQDYYIYGSTILARVEPDAFCSYGERREGE